MDSPSSCHLCADTNIGKMTAEQLWELGRGRGPFTPKTSEKMVTRIADRFGGEAAEEWREWRDIARQRQQCKWARKQLRKNSDRHSKRLIQLEDTLAEHTEKWLARHPPETRNIDMLEDFSSRDTTASQQEENYEISVDAEFYTDAETWIPVSKADAALPDEEDIKMDETKEWELVEHVTQEVKELKV